MQLFHREVQLLDLLVQGKLNKEIAFELGVTPGTVKAYLYRLYRKISVQTRTQAAVWWIEERPWHEKDSVPDALDYSVTPRAAAQC